MNLYIISLFTINNLRNKNLIESIKNYNINPILVPATRGSCISSVEYFNLIQNYYIKTGKVLSPAEIGCALSHKKAIEKAIYDGNPYVFIVEDDVILDEYALSTLNSIAEKLDEGFDLIHLGGMNCLPQHFNKIRGDLISAEPMMFTIYDQDIQHLQGAVAYIASQNAAIKINQLQNEGAYLTDDYRYIQSHLKLKILLANIAKHPIDFTSSSIEEERSIRINQKIHSGTPLIKRIYNEIAKTFAYKTKPIKDRIFEKDKKLIHKQLQIK